MVAIDEIIVCANGGSAEKCPFNTGNGGLDSMICDGTMILLSVWDDYLDLNQPRELPLRWMVLIDS